MKQTLKRILAILLVFIFIVQASPLQSFAASLHSNECAFLADAGETDFNTYDTVGNITSFTFTPSDTSQSAKSVYYTYNSSNQLTREDNQFANKTFVYFVTSTGNISSIQETTYTAPGTTPSNRQTVTDMVYDDWVWIDRVTEINGDAVTYDAIGNPTAIGDVSLMWQGRNMTQYADDTNVYNYVYDMSGRRTTKSINGTQTKFYYEGDTLVAQQTGSTGLTFMYDANGAAYGFFYNSRPYFYIRNLPGDIVGITDSAGTVLGTYVYDAWGNLIESASNISNSIAAMNPLRYRGYYYDTETGYYFLNSRYYNPKTGRFLNADNQISTGGLNGLNMYAYCDNNPVNRIDPTGEAFETIWDILSIGFGLLDVFMNPKDIWAWIGLGADILDLIPFITCLGESVRTIRTVNGLLDTLSDFTKADNVTDSFTTIYRSVSKAEADDIMATGRFNLSPTGMEAKQFGFSYEETVNFGQKVGQNITVSAQIPTKTLTQFYDGGIGGIDTSIFHNGTLTIYGDQLDIFNESVKGTIKFMP